MYGNEKVEIRPEVDVRASTPLMEILSMLEREIDTYREITNALIMVGENLLPRDIKNEDDNSQKLRSEPQGIVTRLTELTRRLGRINEEAGSITTHLRNIVE